MLLVFYTVLASITTFYLYENANLAFVGIVEGSGAEVAIDAGAAIAYLIVISSLILKVVQVVLDSQDEHAEALAQERRAVELKNEFVSMVSHELRTPLTGIAGFTDTLAESWTTLAPEEIDEYLRFMRDDNEHLSKGSARLQQGVGLGLPIARMLARAMGGDLWYEERFPVGARFCFSVTLPGEDRSTGIDTEEPAIA